jgi:hypothetical protein
MASKRRLKRKSCKGKIAYSDKTKAIAAARSLFKKTGEYVQAYKCRYSDHWHCGHWRSGSKL